jgi:hypothetical protein
MTFSRRVINLSFQLGSGDFGTAGQDTVTLEGLRCSVNIVHGGLLAARADVQIWGMTLDLMNKLTVTQKFFMEQRPYNRLTISAGDENGTAVCFSGGILEAWADGRQPPDMMFHVTAASGLIDMSQTIPPTSYKGSVDAATVLAGLAQQIGYSFENSGVTATLTSPYKPGSPKSQIESVCNDIGCSFLIDEAARVLAVWPKGQARDGEVVLISKDTGLIGYPAFTQAGVHLSTLYNPSLEFGRKVKIESQFEPANGQWMVAALAHRLDSNLPGGQWFTDIETSYLDYVA